MSDHDWSGPSIGDRECIKCGMSPKYWGGEECDALVDDMAKAIYDSYWGLVKDLAWDQLHEGTKDIYRRAVHVVVQKLLER